jgi:NCAIR mutase (PurE)-related protein
VRPDRIRDLLKRVRRGETAVEEAVRRLSSSPGERMGFAELDHHRARRLGHPEAVLCEGKTTGDLLEICRRLAAREEGFLATRADAGQLEALREEFPSLEVSERGRIAHLPPEAPVEPPVRGEVLVVSAGTSDLPVAEEARFAARALGNPVRARWDVGVAGLHRILGAEEELRDAAVVVVVAGMDGALPSVVGGLVPAPVVAVPTSAGYGAALEGVAPLLTMLNACSPGVTVVNIDNGYGAAAAATRINQHRPGDAE